MLFYAPVADLKLLDVLEFYSEDIRSLEALGFTVVKTNSMLTALFGSADFMYAWWWHLSLPVIAGWRLRRRPVVVTGASDLGESSTSGSALKRNIRDLLSRGGLTLSTVNIAISDHEWAKLAAAGAKDLERLYPSVDTSFFGQSAKFPNPAAIVVSQLNPLSIRRKGVDVAIRAAAIVRDTVPDFRLLLVGLPTDAGLDMVALLQEECGQTGVEVIGEVSREEKRKLLAGSWFSLQPSVYEGFGVSVLEAMASGTVPICSRAGALPEVVGSAGVLLNGTDPGIVAAAVLDLIGNIEARTTLALEARERALQFDSRLRTARLGEILSLRGIDLPTPLN